MARAGARLSDILDSRRRVRLELAFPLAQQKLNGCKVAFVNTDALCKFCPRKSFKMWSSGLGLLAALAKTVAVEAQNLFLEAGEAHCADWRQMKCRCSRVS